LKKEEGDRMATKSALEIVVELKMLASMPANRSSMCETVVPGLVMFLDHPGSDVVFNGEWERVVAPRQSVRVARCLKFFEKKKSGRRRPCS
jgi:hypothetical protein